MPYTLFLTAEISFCWFGLAKAERLCVTFCNENKLTKEFHSPRHRPFGNIRIADGCSCLDINFLRIVGGSQSRFNRPLIKFKGEVRQNSGVPQPSHKLG
jgi:hypothetical protein